jgi:hypothetical protein
MKRALIYKNKVIEVSNNDFQVSDEMFWVDCDDNCEPGWIYEPETGIPHEPHKPSKTIDQIIFEYKSAIKGLLSKEASKKGYDSELSFVSYINSKNEEWKSEADIFISWRDSAWLYQQDIEDQVRSGALIPPAVDDFIAGAPKYIS